MSAQLADIILEGLDAARKAGALDFPTPPQVVLEAPRQAAHGDVACPVALGLAKIVGRPPRDIAQTLIDHLTLPDGLVDKVEIAGPGFINFHLAPAYWTARITDIIAQGDTYGHNRSMHGQKVLAEFVSANPTGPLHVGHGRGAVVGDAAARLLSACGAKVDREYYVNNVGNQMNILGRSTHYRYLELLGRTIAFPDDHYKGAYIGEIARRLLDADGDIHADTDEEAWLPRFTDFAYSAILEDIRAELNAFDVHFDRWYSEKDLYVGDPSPVQAALDALAEQEMLYEKDGAKWLATTRHGDDKDRVLVRANGVTTYFASDVAYHKEKFARGYHRLIDVWGADHHGYVGRMKAAAAMVGKDPEALTVILVQLVSLLKGGEPVAMSTRAGSFVTLAQVVEEIGKDATRFYFLTRKSDAHLEFDLELAKSQTSDNPVYYVQYAHARVHQLFGKALERYDIGPDETRQAGDEGWDLSALEDAETIALIKKLTDFPKMVEDAAAELAVHRTPYYLQELAAQFHAYYYKHRFVSDDLPLTRARMVLATAVGQVLKNGLTLMGVGAPTRM
ncbi:MAG: arginine--tRNA ligase [Leptospirillia bacterium]